MGVSKLTSRHYDHASVINMRILSLVRIERLPRSGFPYMQRLLDVYNYPVTRHIGCHIQPDRYWPPRLTLYIASHLSRGFAGRPLEIKWLPMLPIFLGFSRFFRHFEGQWFRMLLCKNHRHYPDLIANQTCYDFRRVLSYFHNDNELNTMFMRQTPVLVDLKDGGFPTVDMVTS